MGILNLTPDSFFEPSRYNMDILHSGADIIDIGAVSSRPGAEDVSPAEEWERLESVLRIIPKGQAISIDTTRSEIVRKAHRIIGHFIVNDISSGTDDPDMLTTVSELGLGYIAMHKRGNPRTMDSLAVYDDVVEEVIRFFREFDRRAQKAGIREWILDPGFGFAKNDDQNLELLHGLGRLKVFGKPVLAGIADKRFTHGRTEQMHREAILGGADILRVHDVSSARRTLEGLGPNCP